MLLDLIPIAFDDDLDIQVQLNGLFADKANALRTMWDFIVISFRFFGELVGLHRYCYDIFQRLDKYFVQHSTLLIEDYEAIIDIFRFCVNKNENRLGSRNIKHIKTDDSTDLLGPYIVMEESVLPRALSTQGSTSLVHLILSPAEIQMNTWKPTVQNIMQQFQDFDNEGYDIKTCLYDILQNSKMRFNQCKEVFLSGLTFTEAPSASN